MGKNILNTQSEKDTPFEYDFESYDGNGSIS